jgi:hypothetical protein
VVECCCCWCRLISLFACVRFFFLSPFFLDNAMATPTDGMKLKYFAELATGEASGVCFNGARCSCRVCECCSLFFFTARVSPGRPTAQDHEFCGPVEGGLPQYIFRSNSECVVVVSAHGRRRRRRRRRRRQRARALDANFFFFCVCGGAQQTRPGATRT